MIGAARPQDAHIALAISHEDLGQPAEAQRAYEGALEANAASVRALVALGRVHQTAGRLDVAQGLFARAFEARAAAAAGAHPSCARAAAAGV